MHVLIAKVLNGQAPTRVIAELLDHEAQRFLSKYGERAFQVPMIVDPIERSEQNFIVSPSLSIPGGWRVTTLDKWNRVTGHASHKTFRKALAFVASMGVDWNRLELGPVVEALVEDRPPSFNKLELARERVGKWMTFAAINHGRSFEAPASSRIMGMTIIVSPSLDPRFKWRVTRLDRRGPVGHTEFREYEDAVIEAGRAGADLDKAVFGPQVAEALTEAEWVTDEHGDEIMLPRDPQFRRMVLASIERAKAAKKFAARHRNKSFQVPGRRDNIFLIVSPSLDSRFKWRMTRLDDRGPIGHRDFRTYEEAVIEAGDEGDLTKATFA